MVFSFVFEISLILLLLVLCVGIVFTLKKTRLLKEKSEIRTTSIKFKLKNAHQKKRVLENRIKLSNNVNSSLFHRLFTIIDRLLSLQRK